MRGLLAFACRAFPGDYRARRSDEIVDTALLVADGSRVRAAREALSLVLAGTRERLRAESSRPLRDGLTLLAGALALVNLAIALAKAVMVVHPSLPPILAPYPYEPDWWWIGFTIAAAGIVLGLVLGDRWLALGAALANLGFIAYEAIFSFHPGGSLLMLIHYAPVFPAGRDWLAPAVVLVLAIAAAPLRRPPLMHLPLAAVAVTVLVVFSREWWGDFYFLRWPLAAVLVLAIAFGSLMPRLAVLAGGAVVAVAPSRVSYLTAGNLDHHVPSATTFVLAALVLRAFVPFARLVRRRLT